MTSSTGSEREPLLPRGEVSQTPSGNRPLNELSTWDLCWVLGALWSAVFLGAMDTTLVATLLTPIGSYFDKAHQSSYLGTSYLLSVCCFTPLYGRLSDILGRKGAMILALTLFGIGNMLCALAPSMESLIVARAIAGMGGGGVMTVSSIAVTDLVPLKQRGLYQGFANILYGAGSGLGGPLGGLLYDRWGWRPAFLIQVPIIILSCFLVSLKVNIKIHDSQQTWTEKLARVDWFGSLSLVTAVGGFLLALSLKWTEDLSFGDPLVWGLFLASVIGAVFFFAVESYWAAEPIMPLRLLRRRTPLAVALSNLGISMLLFSSLYNVPLYFSAVMLQSAKEAGLHLLPNSIALSVGSLFAGWVMRATGKYWWLTLLSIASMVLSAALLATWHGADTPGLHLWFDVVPGGLGGASAITSTLIALVSSVDREDMAVATGVSYLFRTTGQVLGVALTGALSQSLLLNSLRAKIHGPNAEKIISDIRHSISVIPTLDPPTRQAAVDSWAFALRVVFACQVVFAILVLLCALPIEEFELAGTHAEHDKNSINRRGTNDQSPTPRVSA